MDKANEEKLKSQLENYKKEIGDLFDEKLQLDDYKNICIYGGKGVGKTHFIKEKLMPSLEQEGVKVLKVSCTDFVDNFSGGNESLRSKSHKVISNFIKKNSASWDENLDASKSSFLLSIISAFFAFIISITSVSFAFFNLKDYIFIATLSVVSLLALISFLLWFFLSFKSTFKKITLEKDFYKSNKISIPNKRKTSYKNKKYLIFIDDLNRLTRETQEDFIMKVSGVNNVMCTPPENIILVFITSDDLVNKSDSDFVYKFLSKRLHFKFDLEKLKYIYKDRKFSDYEKMIFSKMRSFRQINEYVNILDKKLLKISEEKLKMFDRNSVETVSLLETIYNEDESIANLLEKIEEGKNFEFHDIWNFKKYLEQKRQYSECFETIFEYKRKFWNGVVSEGFKPDKDFVNPKDHLGYKYKFEDLNKLPIQEADEIKKYNSQSNEYYQNLGESEYVFTETNKIINLKNRKFSKFLINPEIINNVNEQNKSEFFLEYIDESSRLLKPEKCLDKFLEDSFNFKFWEYIFIDSYYSYNSITKISSSLSIFLNDKFKSNEFDSFIENFEADGGEEMKFEKIYHNSLFNLNLYQLKKNYFRIESTLAELVKKRYKLVGKKFNNDSWRFYVDDLNESLYSGHFSEYQKKHEIANEFILNSLESNTESYEIFQRLLIYWWSLEIKLGSFFNFLLGCIFTGKWFYNKSVLKFIINQDEKISTPFTIKLKNYLKSKTKEYTQYLEEPHNLVFAREALPFIKEVEDFIENNICGRSQIINQVEKYE
ncbi:ATP-binding protein [Spiroplasma alleghenense]|uniref:Uncharacterized protein n=1 Tax=Spiroplasma alleghenense TaxID=216931 RepID=A0A345Z4V3_9MOLU|nr:ATP-binding protein [Spiroplasma alleghenense]AXK51632.1 hypothetical protein SALLE_v1c09620 [Spiroplasma alleghenense]